MHVVVMGRLLCGFSDVRAGLAAAQFVFMNIRETDGDLRDLIG